MPFNVCDTPPFRVLKNVFVRASLLSLANVSRRLSLLLSSSRPYAPSTLPSPHPSILPPVREAHAHKSFANQLVGLNGLTANRFPNCQTNSMQSLPAIRFLPSAENSVSCCRELCFPSSPCFLQADKSHRQVVGPSPGRSRHAHTHSSLSQPGCAHCRSLPPQVPPSVSLEPRVLQTLPADAWSDPSVFFFFVSCIFRFTI